jgi:hypothetical protein
MPRFTPTAVAAPKRMMVRVRRVQRTSEGEAVIETA